jgi:putative spermidine/putrescine transport system permease protein
VTAVLDAPAPAAHVPPRPARRHVPRVLLFLPALALLAVAFGLPLLQIVLRSFTDPDVGLTNYTAMLDDGITTTVILRTLRVAVTVVVLALLLAYPYAYVMSIASPAGRAVLTTLVLLPFWTSLMARNFAWLLLMQDGGPIQRFFSLFGLDVVLLGTTVGVTVAMTQVLLPFMVLPLYSSMQQIDRRLLQAAQSLGAKPRTAFRKIYLPLSAPGVVAGCTLVFILSLGFYITPALLGSSQQSLVAQLLAIRTTALLDFAGAGALGTVLLVITGLVLAVIGRFARPASSLAAATGGVK